MSFDYQAVDEYDRLAARFKLYEPGERDDYRTPRAGIKPKKAQPPSTAAEAAATTQTPDGALKMTYRPARYETVWLSDSLRPFYTQNLIVDVLALVKGGKEANVYLCEAAPHLKVGLIAAKVYRPRQFRNLRNDKMYREGRELLNVQGIPIKNRDNREMRAIHKKTAFGAELTHISWLMHEYVTLQRLHAMGAAVPEPLATGENAILMAFVGNRSRPAPVLHAVALARREVEPLFDEVMRNVELMLRHGMIHGDLSAFNILYWEGKITVIDFPQVTLSESNHNAYRIFQRDVQRVCEYFAMQGLEQDAGAITQRLWKRYVGLTPGHTIQDEV